MSAVSLHAFNLLPYRSGARRRARNRALAVLAGGDWPDALRSALWRVGTRWSGCI